MTDNAQLSGKTSSYQSPAQINCQRAQTLRQWLRVSAPQMATRLLMCVVLCTSEIAAAQEAARADSVPNAGRTSTIIVSASRLDQSITDYAGNVSVLTPAHATNLPASYTGSLLQWVPGFHFADYTGNGSRQVISPRGFTAGGEGEYVELVIDGLPANELQKGVADFNLLPLSQLQSIEVLRGPSSALYGDQATAGVVSVSSLSRSSPFLSGRAGSFGNFAVETGAGVLASRGHANGSGDWMQSDGWRDRSRWIQGRGFGRGALQLGKGQQLLSSALVVYSDRENPGPVPRAWLTSRPRDAFYDSDGQEAVRVLVGVGVAGSLGSNKDHTSRMYLRTRDADVVRTLSAALQAAETRREELDERTVGLESRAKAELWDSRQLIQVGLEAERGTLDNAFFEEDQTTKASSGHVRRVKVAPYLQSVTRLFSNTQLTVGVRYDHFDLRFDQTLGGDTRSDRTLSRFSPKSAVNWSWSRGNIYGSIAGVYKIPTLEQLYDLRRPFGLDLANPNLEAQHGQSYEVGFRLNPDPNSYVELAAYRINMRDEIAFNAAEFQFQNIGKSDHTGIELGAERRFTRWLTTKWAYTWTDAFFRSGDVDGNRINGIPAHRGMASVDFELPAAVGLGVSMEANSAQQLDESNTHELRGFVVTNLKLRRSFSGMSGYLHVNNVFDQRYGVSGIVLPFDGAELIYPGTGANIVFGFQIKR